MQYAGWSLEKHEYLPVASTQCLQNSGGDIVIFRTA